MEPVNTPSSNAARLSPWRVVWMTPVILKGAASVHNQQQAEGGTWLDTLFDQLRVSFGSKVEFHVIHPMKSVEQTQTYKVDGVHYYLTPRRKYGHADAFAQEVKGIVELVKSIDPQLAHIHGTEEFYGLSISQLPCPAVVSLQGFRQDIQRSYFTDVTRWEYIKMNLRRKKINWYYNLKYLAAMAELEKQIFAQARYFIGRTEYDRLHSLGRQSQGTYFGECHDILRDAFYSERWQLHETEDFSIHTTLTERPYKGIFLLLETVRLLAQRYPAVRLNIAGSMKGVMGQEAQQWVRKHGLSENVRFLGRCTSEEITASMKRSRVFVLGSFVENESLSLQEAQALGMPCVAPNVGGVPSMFTSEKEGRFYPTGDAYYLAGVIGEMFDDTEKSVEMGLAARELVLRRNDPAAIGQRYVDIYTHMIAGTELPDPDLVSMASTVS